MIELCGLTKRFGGETAVDHLSLTIYDGELFGLLGPNGAGKTTTVSMLSTVLLPTEGQILLDGKDITDLEITERANLGIGYAFQQPVKFKGIRVFDLLKIASGQTITIKEACSFLSEVGLCAKDYIERDVNASLSGGELKRIEIATVLARKTRLSVFDEPEAGIDLWSFQNLVRIFEKMQTETRDSAILVISHQERILNIADEIIVLSGGGIEHQGSRDEVLPKILGTEAAVDACARLNGQEVI